MSVTKVQTINQHYIPRLLLRRFSRCENPEVKSKRRVYKALEVGRKTAEEKNIVEIAAEEYFFEKDIVNGFSVEEELKIKENRYGRLLDTILNSRQTHRSQNILITDLVSNLSFRTENNRLEMAKLLADSISWARTQVTADKLFIKQVEREALDAVVKELGRGMEREKLAKARFGMKNSRVFKHELARRIEALPMVSKLVEEKFASESYGIAQKTQCSLISEKELTRNATLGSIEWSLKHFDTSLLLGDLGPICFCQKEQAYMPLMWALVRRSVNHLVLPISNSAVLIGRAKDHDDELLIQQTDASTINSASASLSYNFFVTDEVELASLYANQVGSMNENYNSKWVREGLPFSEG